LYLDECANSDLLASLLRQAGHLVTRSNDPDVGLERASDETHLRFAISRSLILITKNPSHFFNLHLTNPDHFGIFGIFQDNDYSRDMKDAEIVKAIQNIEEAFSNGGEPLQKTYQILNQWRY
jgi:hypothetical protein